MLEMEKGRDFEVKKVNQKINTFFTTRNEKIEVEAKRIPEADYLYPITYFFDDEEEIRNDYRKRLEFSGAVNKESKLADAMKNIESHTKTFKTSQEEIVCPCCHKVENIEKFITVKPNKKPFIEGIEKKGFNNWLSLFKKDTTLLYSDYFEIEMLADTYGYPDIIEYDNHEGVIVAYKIRLTCPECGKVIDTEKHPFEKLSNVNRMNSKNIKAQNYVVFKDTNKTAISIIYSSYFINMDAKKLSAENFRVRVVFNHITGQSYFIGPKKLNGKSMSGYIYQRFINITYRFNKENYPSYILDILNSDDVKKELFMALIEAHDDYIDRFLDFPSEKGKYFKNEEGELIFVETPFSIFSFNFKEIPFFWLCIYNRLPALNGKQIMDISPDEIDDGYNCFIPNQYMSKLFKGCAPISSSNEILNQMLKNIKLPNNKTTRKLLTTNISTAIDLVCFSRLGFKDINIIYRFLSLDDSVREEILIILNYEKEGFMKKDVSKTKKFVKDMIKHKGESKTFNTLFADKSNIRYIEDSAMMYAKFKESNLVTKEFFTDNILKIHDRMSKDFSKIRYANVEIPYPEKAKIYNKIVKGFEFRLAKDTNELIKIGQDLKICVGGYRDIALSGRSLIISVSHDSEYCGCVELSQSEKELIQAKSVYNNVFQERKAEALKEWVETFDIDTGYCNDYTHISEGEISYDKDAYTSRTYDYHNLELDDQGNVITK